MGAARGDDAAAAGFGVATGQAGVVVGAGCSLVRNAPQADMAEPTRMTRGGHSTLRSDLIINRQLPEED